MIAAATSGSPVVATVRELVEIDPRNTLIGMLHRDFGTHVDGLRFTLRTVPIARLGFAMCDPEVYLDDEGDGDDPRAAYEQVLLIAAAYRCGEDIEPLVVHLPDDGTPSAVYDGFHRLSAAGLADVNELSCWVLDPTTIPR